MKYVYDLATLHTFSSFFANEEILSERNPFTTIRIIVEFHHYRQAWLPQSTYSLQNNYRLQVEKCQIHNHYDIKRISISISIRIIISASFSVSLSISITISSLPHTHVYHVWLCALTGFVVSRVFIKDLLVSHILRPQAR